MCGIAGVMAPGGRRSLPPDLLDRMAGTLAHRGPDATGTLWSGPCGLAHTRLSIIDLSPAGSQPMANEDGSVVIAYNGEVYNFMDLRRRFRLDDGHEFRSRTDTEVLLHLYEELGPDFLRELDGMYALAVWDSGRGELLLARDPFGIKPLFTMRRADGLWFASEPKALLEAPGQAREACPTALSHYLAFDYVPGTLTPFKGIGELKPGTAMVVGGEGEVMRRWRFFAPSYREDRSIREREAVDASGRLLRRAVEKQLVSDVPVGVMLSGGMDSSALTAMMARIRGDAGFHTFSIAFDDPSFDESPWAGEVADATGTTHHVIRVTAGDVERLLPRYLSHIDEPYADGSAIPTWLLARTAAEHVTVLLSGEGGDEVFGGYDTHAALKARKLYRRLLPGFLRRGLVYPLVHALPVSHRKLSLEFKAKRFTEGAEMGVPESHFYWRVVLGREGRASVLGEAFRDLAGLPPEGFFRDVYGSCDAESDLNRILCIDTGCHLPNDLMIKNDRMTMAHSLEARVPFTDLELFRYLATVPAGVKLPGMRKKRLLRKAMEGVLPPSVVSKKKVGLEMPYSRWFREELRESSRTVLMESGALVSGLFDRRGVAALWDEHQSMARDNGRALWGLLNYFHWYDSYVASDSYRQMVRPPRPPRS